MKFKNLQNGDTFKSERFGDLIFERVPLIKGTCCTPGHNAVGVAHTTEAMFAAEDEIELVSRLGE